MKTNLFGTNALLAAPSITSSGVDQQGKPLIRWNAVPEAVRYTVYRATSSEGVYTRYYTTPYTSFNNASAKAGMTYYYKICAVEGDGSEGALTSPLGIKARLAEPTISSVGADEAGEPCIKWFPVEGAQKYVIYRSISPDGAFRKYFTTAATSFTNFSAETGDVFFYKIAAADAKGNEGVFTSVLGIQARLPKVTITDAKLNEAGRPVLNWNAVPGATRYAVYRAGAEDEELTRYFTTIYTTFTNKSAAGGETYSYEVCAVGIDGSEGPHCPTVTLTATAETCEEETDGELEPEVEEILEEAEETAQD